MALDPTQLDVVSWREVISVAVALIGSMLGGMWWLARVIVAQQKKLLDAQFAAQSARWELQASTQGQRISDIERRLGEETEATKQLKSELQKLREEMPTRYVMRDDWIRFSGTFGERMDRLHDKIDDFIRGEYARRSE